MKEARTYRDCSGFSLVELIISIAVIGTSVILVVGAFIVLVKGTQKASDLTSGSVAADGLLSQEIYQIMCVDSVRIAYFKDTTSYRTPTLVRGGTYQLNNTLFLFKIYLQDIPLSAANLHNIQTDVNGRSTPLKRLDVVVWWDDLTSATQTQANSMTMQQQARGSGMQQVHQMRVLWPTGSY